MNNSSEKFAKINKIFSKLFPVIVVFFILVIFIATLWKIPQYQVSHFSSGINDSVKLAELEDKFRSTIAQILGGFVIVIGLYLTHRRVAATEKSLVLTQESQIIDRFTRSIELLGKDELEFKLGGIYGLERTANESEKDYWPIMSILCTYIRKNSPSMVEKNGKFEKNTAPLSMDSQAVLNVLKRTNELRKTKMIVNVFDLNDACLIGANLFEAELIHSNFSKSNLFDVTANDANFSDSYFGHTNLNRSDLMNVNFSGSKFISSNLSESVIVEANFSNTDLSRVDFSRSILIGSNFSNCKSSGLNFYDADLSDSNFSNSILRDSSFIDSILVNVNLSNANLAKSNFSNATLINANLEGANLKGVNFEGANLEGANLKGADSEGANFEGANIKGTLLENTRV